MTDRSFEQANDESRARLSELIHSLTPEQMAVDLGSGWTVASALAHTGFWDRWQAERWSQILAGKWSAEDDSVIAAEHLANEALHPYWAGIEAEYVPALALAAATRIDSLIAAAPDAVVDRIEGTAADYILHRYRHRNDHLDHIARSITAASDTAADRAGAATAADRVFIAKNAASRRHLASLVERLRESDLRLLTEEGGWTIAQALGHLAFWDRSMATRWRLAADAAGDGGAIEPIGIPDTMTDAINLPLAALLDTWTSQIGIGIGRQAVEAADSVDALVLELAGRLPEGLAVERQSLVNRWSHREAHLEEIEKALSAVRPEATAVDRAYLDRNASSLARLRGVLGGLTAADLARSAGDGEWTIGQIIGHLTFWDRFLAARWRAALAGGPGEQPSYMPHELADLLNDGLPPTWNAFASTPGDAVSAEALAAAEEVDGIIAALPDLMPIASILNERPALLDRSSHRLSHVGQIERVLGR
jgi:riboflavin biosynthesis pyrimidine reductase